MKHSRRTFTRFCDAMNVPTRGLCLSVLILCCGSLSAAVSISSTISDMEALELFNKASSLYQQASKLPPSEGEKAYDLYAQAADTYNEILRRGFEHPDIYYNLGNSSFKVSDLGQAILNYRRAQRLIGDDADLIENLRSAKSKIVDDEPMRGPPELLRTIFFWYFDTTVDFLAKCSLAAYLLLCATILTYILLRKQPILAIIKVELLVTVILSVSFGLRLLNEQRTAVVLVQSAPVRTGYSENEASRFTVHAGTELTVEDEQLAGDVVWYKVALSKELRGWIRSTAVGIVQAPPDTDPVISDSGDRGAAAVDESDVSTD